DTAWMKKEKYEDVLVYGFLNVLERYYTEYGFIPRNIQNTILYDLSWYIQYLINKPEKINFLSEDEKKDALIFRLQYCGVDDFNEMRKEFGRRLRLQDKKRLMGFGKEDFEKEVYEIANYIVQQCAPIGVGIAKQMVNFGGSVPIDIGLEMESYGYGLVAGTTDFIEGLTAAGQGRLPKYQNK
ncbi:hypothetical protein LCGC14_1380850, partial [marine sediment metagenome]